MADGPFAAVMVDGAAPERDRRGAATAVQVFGEALAAGDPEAAAACFSSEACLLTADGTEVTGRKRVRAVLTQLTASGAEIRFDPPRFVTLGEVTLCWQSWTMRFGSGPGAGYERPALSISVLRCRGDRWEFLINALWGHEAGALRALKSAPG